MDVHSPAQRSFNMSRIKGAGNKKTELKLISLFRENGITGWRRHLPVFGKPDFVFRKQRIAIFVDGCFWHGCPKHSNLPLNNREFWQKKLTGNITRDKIVNRRLRKEGWSIIRIWEHDLSKRSAVSIRKIQKQIDAFVP